MCIIYSDNCAVQEKKKIKHDGVRAKVRIGGEDVTGAWVRRSFKCSVNPKFIKCHRGNVHCTDESNLEDCCVN